MDGQVYKHVFIDKDMNFHTFSVEEYKDTQTNTNNVNNIWALL